MQQSFSFKTETWKRLKKNKGAIFGLVIIGVAVLLSIFGYLIAPDNSPNADLQTVEIQAKKPGYTQQFLKVPAKQMDDGSWFTHMLFGKKLNYRFIPIKGYAIKSDSLLINKFIDDDTAVVQYFSINQITTQHRENISQYLITKKYCTTAVS